MNSMLKTYYKYKKIIPRSTQLLARKMRAEYITSKNKASWPCSDFSPLNLHGPIWGNGKKFCFVLTHDVDTGKGLGRCRDVMHIEKKLGFRSSFSIVPERYAIDDEILKEIKDNGFELCVHGVTHDGCLFLNKKVFDKRKNKINEYLNKWGAVGFRSPAMHHNLLWISELNIEYDMSTYDFDPFEPQGGGVGVIYPFIIQHPAIKRKIVEIPYTLPQDHTLFIILKKKGIDEWIHKLDYIAAQGGVALVITHPDYMNFGSKIQSDEYSSKMYIEFLHFVKERYEGMYWNALPHELAMYWKENEKNAFKVGGRVVSSETLCQNCKEMAGEVVLK